MFPVTTAKNFVEIDHNLSNL